MPSCSPNLLASSPSCSGRSQLGRLGSLKPRGLQLPMKHISELDGLRGILSVWVVCLHLMVTVGLRGWAFLAHPGMPVDVCVILSGFAIFHLLNTKEESYGTFIVRRWFRLYPTYLVSLLLAASLLAHLSLFHGTIPSSLLPSSSYALLGQAWSSSLEWQFYLVAPLLYWLLKRWRFWGTLWLTATVLWLCWYWESWPALLPAKFHLFALGIASWFLWQSRWVCKVAAGPWGIALVPLTAGLLYGLVVDVGIWLWILLLLLLLRTRGGARNPLETFLTKALSNGPVAFLGRISYPIYLVHMHVLCLVLPLLGPAISKLSAAQAFLLLAVVVFSLTILSAYVLARVVERPLMRVGKEWASRRSCGPAPIAQPTRPSECAGACITAASSLPGIESGESSPNVKATL